MKTISDVLQRDPATNGLVNQGQARIVDRLGDKEFEELRGELSTFVCEGQFAEGIQKILRSFLDNQGRTSQKGGWVSGFYGSGKSHLLKMACHLWQDTPFSNGSTARSLVPHIPDEIAELLRELDTAGRRAGGLLAAAGAMPSGSTDNVRLTILGVLLRAVKLPGLYPQARFCLWLNDNGWLDAFRESVEAAGKSFDREINDLYVSPVIAKALLKCAPEFATSEAEARKALRAQFPPATADITTEEFLRTVRDALSLVGKDGKLPCTLLILDELQQYIGRSLERSVVVTETIEAISKQLDSKVVVVAAGQNAVTEAEQLKRLMDRCTVRTSLSDVEVETVTRKVILQKKPNAVEPLRKLLNAHAGEVSRQLQGTRIGERQEDQAVIVDDYPMLPVRRRFWEACFRAIDSEGMHSQLRSYLRIIHDAVARISQQPLGAIVPADELYDALAPELVSTSVLLRHLSEKINRIGQTEDRLSQRICGLIFLISKLPRGGGADIGVRATPGHVADLLVDNLVADNGKLRAQVDEAMRKLADKGILMEVEGEYRLQTPEGNEWDREFRVRQTRLNSDNPAIDFRRDELLNAEAYEVIRSLRLLQGAAKEPRQCSIHREQIPPPIDGATIPVWIRDGWSHAEKEMVDVARTSGPVSPLICVFVPRQSAEDLRRLIVDTDAAQQTLDARGNPTTAEGQEARQSMESRRAAAVEQRDRLIKDIVENAKVFQGGGSEVLSITLVEKLKSAANDALVRMFPRFKEADSAAWETAMKRAKEGGDHPFQPVGHNDATEKHPVCQEVLATIGSGKSGSDVRKVLQASPLGWPKEAIDAALIALHRSQHISATLNNAPVALGQLDHNKITKAQFRVEQSTLSVQDRLQLRKLFQQVGLSCKTGEESNVAAEFLRKLIELAKSAGGEAPLPATPAVADLEELQRLVGNDQLFAIKAGLTDLEGKIKAWMAARDLANTRLPIWDLIQRLARQARDLPAAQPHIEQLESIKTDRLLLEKTDKVAPLRASIAQCLRDAVNHAHEALADSCKQALTSIGENDVWKKLPAGDQNGILQSVGLVAPAKPSIATDEQLAAQLEAKPLVSLQTERDAVAGRQQQAIESAAKKLEPKVQPVAVDRATLRTEADVNDWIDKTKTKLLGAVKKGPVLIK